MFGKNPIRSRDDTADGRLAVQEIFYTIQGEGPQSGRPCVFIRLAGCNLACVFCDTEFESNIDNRLSVDEIALRVEMALERNLYPHASKRLVVLTGGEPMRQDVVPLIARLLQDGVELVQIETAGTLWLDGIKPFIEEGSVQIVCSPKTPNINPMIAKWTRHYKYVITFGETSDLDGLPLRGTQQSTMLTHQTLYRPWGTAEYGPPTTIWVSPCDAHDDAKTAANVKHAVEVAMRFGHRLSLQTHKIIGLP